MANYKRLVRLFSEQCIIEKDDSGARAVIKASKECHPVHFRIHLILTPVTAVTKAKTTICKSWTYSKDKSQPNLITHVAANKSDTNALLLAIENAGKRYLAPTELLADTLYSSDDNVDTAKELGITVIAPENRFTICWAG